MTIREACELVLQSIQLNTKNKILFLDMGKPVKIIDVIQKIFLISKKPNQKLNQITCKRTFTYKSKLQHREHKQGRS